MNILKVITPKRITGNFGEKAAVKHLKKLHYKILERNYAAIGSEIDIIAKNKDTVVFVEVKTRTVGHESPMESRPAASVNFEKQKKIIKLASYYLAGYPALSLAENMRIRFDIIEVYVRDENEKKKLENICHIEGAFRRNYEIYKH